MTDRGERAKAEALMNVSRETLAKLEIYETRLKAWGHVKNLVAPASLEHIWLRHFADCYQMVALGNDAQTWVDLGSGAGFPGLVIAIALSGSNRKVHLVESDHRKCAFLRDVTRETGAPAVIHNLRIEDSYAAVGKVDMVTARALAPMPKLLSLAMPFIDQGATALFMKGLHLDNELHNTTISGNLELTLLDSRVDPTGRIVKIEAKRHLPE